eukprot:6943994-Prymnesium_polylepis.1
MVASGIDERAACGMAVHEVGRASGTLRCRLLDRMYDMAAARWATEVETGATELRSRCQELELAAKQAEREKRHVSTRERGTEERVGEGEGGGRPRLLPCVRAARWEP